MGELPSGEAHEESLSGMSYAWRWARAHKKVLLSVAAVCTAAVVSFTAMIYGTEMKRVTVVTDGETHEFVTSQEVVGDLLAEQGIEVGEHDVVSIPLDAELSDEAEVTIEKAFPVTVSADGETKQVYTVASWVGDVLRENNIDVGPLDKVFPALNNTVTAETDIKVVRVTRTVEETEHPLPFETVKQADASLLKGQEKVVQKGQEGVLVKQIERLYEDGVLVSEEVVARNVEQESQNHIVAVGTKAAPPKVTNAVAVLSAEAQKVTLDGMTFAVKDVLKNVTLTAYSAGPASTGKSKGDPGYGITSSGTTVSEGRTIAVDKDVIPMGWWVYIDGIGFRRAEDTGSAVQGKKIDIYFDSHSHAVRFGTKRGYTVYVIGPSKPSAN